MRTVGDFAPLLGAPVRDGGGPLVEAVAASWSVALPEDYVEIVGAYGDAAIAERLFLLGARNLRSYSAMTGGLLERSGAVPHRVRTGCPAGARCRTGSRRRTEHPQPPRPSRSRRPGPVRRAGERVVVLG
ncbi:hypothetical protein ACIRVF_37105 [Kitasatospora sp. NPDC101157]|uniref:hypothetical protein n=1 Tax=Kitasatospora sp. NPDC101157 TaxID=3364098 RepID=UPI003807D0A3